MAVVASLITIMGFVSGKLTLPEWIGSGPEAESKEAPIREKEAEAELGFRIEERGMFGSYDTLLFNGEPVIRTKGSFGGCGASPDSSRGWVVVWHGNEAKLTFVDLVTKANMQYRILQKPDAWLLPKNIVWETNSNLTVFFELRHTPGKYDKMIFPYTASVAGFDIGEGVYEIELDENMSVSGVRKRA